MKPEKHQRKAARRLASTIIKYGVACLWGEVRSGKTLSFILAAKLLNVKDVLIISTKDAVKDIKPLTPSTFIVTNFEQVKNLSELDKQRIKLIIVDECHMKISQATPKRNQLSKDIREISYNLPIIFASGTPTPETYNSLYSTFWISSQSPFNKYKKFTDWYKDYGTFEQKCIGYDTSKRKPKFTTDWTKGQTKKIKQSIEHLVVNITQEEAGHKFFPVDNLINIPLSRRQERYYKVLEKDKLIELPNDYSIVADKQNLWQKKHQISGGFCKTVYDYDETKTGLKQFKNIPKVEYIKQNYNLNDTIIFCYFVAEQEFLKSIFPNVESITKKSMGTDYSDFDKMIIYSFSHRAVIYEQIRARQMNFKKRKTEIVIDWLISGIDSDIYNCVAVEKRDFTASWYNKRSK